RQRRRDGAGIERDLLAVGGRGALPPRRVPRGRRVRRGVLLLLRGHGSGVPAAPPRPPLPLRRRRRRTPRRLGVDRAVERLHALPSVPEPRLDIRQGHALAAAPRVSAAAPALPAAPARLGDPAPARASRRPCAVGGAARPSGGAPAPPCRAAEA